MKIIAVLTNPIQYTPGRPEVLIPYSIMEPSVLKSGNLSAVNTTQAALMTSGSWGDEECRAAVVDHLTVAAAPFGSVEIEVLFLEEWEARNAPPEN